MSDVLDDLTRVIQLIVDEPEAVEVDEYPEDRSTVFELHVAADDLGKVIGRQGRTARALRALLAARGNRDGCRYELEILDD